MLCLASASTAFGQKFSLGGEAGFVSSVNTDFTITDLENSRNTYYAGLNFSYKYDDRLSFTIRLHYLRQGYRHSTCYIFEEGVKNELVGKIDYLTIPIRTNIHLLKSKRLMASFALIGAYNIKAAQDYPTPIGGCLLYHATGLTKSIQQYSLYGSVGVGYKCLDGDKFELVPHIRYFQGLTNIMKNPYPNMTWVDSYRSFLLTLAFNYKL